MNLFTVLSESPPVFTDSAKDTKAISVEMPIFSRAVFRNWAKITATFKIKYKALSYSSILGEIHPHECLKR